MKKKISKNKMARYKLLVLIILGFLIQFFIREAYSSNIILAVLAAVVFAALGFYYWEKGFFNFFLFALISISFFVALEVSFNFGFYANFILSLFVGVVFSSCHIRWKSNENYALVLLIAFVLVWIINGFNVLDRYDWVLENAINVPFIIIIVFLSRWFRFSKLSYSLIFLYMFMNIVGSHYTYSEVPFGFWMEGFFGLGRNHYDRIIHFLFGLLLAYPLREVYVRIGNYKGFWALMAPIIMVFGLSCIYELVEWWIAVLFGGDLGVAYLGTQGDVWDAQKDMFLAGIGSIVTMFVTLIVILSYKGKKYLAEIKESFRVKKKEELGEVALQKMEKRHK